MVTTKTSSTGNEHTMPVLFVGHGSPMNAIEKNQYSKGWSRVAATLPVPKAILCISAHWLTHGTSVTAMPNPRTIHDFYGFPPELYKVNYAAKGSPATAEMIQKLINKVSVQLDYAWGLDHGTWSVLQSMYPQANIPVLQLSIDPTIKTSDHFEIGNTLRILRKKGVLIIGSGNIVHNLMLIKPDATAYPWAIDFDQHIKKALEDTDTDTLINYQKIKSSNLAVPTNDHYLPLLYTIGATRGEKLRFFNESVSMGSMSMRSVIFGNTQDSL